MAELIGTGQRCGALLRILAVAGAMLLAGCQTIVPRGPVAPVDKPVVAGPPRGPAPIDTGIPQDTARQRVALLVPLTGVNAGVGQSLANATQMAVLDTRAEKVRITTYDTNLGAARAAQRALAEGNKLILGPLLAEDVRAVQPVARAAGVPIISFSNDVGVAAPGTYLLGYSPAQAIERVVQYAHGRGITSFAGLVPNGLYGDRASTAFLRAVEAAGGKVLSLQVYQRAPGSLAAAIARLANNAPYQAVLIADNGMLAASAIPIIRRSGGGNTQILGTELWNSERSIAAAPALNGALFASVADALYLQFATKYRDRFGVAPYRLASLGYDSVLLTVRIMRDWPIGAPFPVDRLADRGGFAGLDGAFRFGRDGVAERALEVQQISGSATSVVSPAPTVFAK